MKKLNLICASIALLAAGAANAGTAVSTATKIAVENFGGSSATQATLAVLGAPISYSMSTITAVNSGSTVYFTVRLTGGVFAGTPNATNFSFGGQVCSANATASNPACVVTPSADASTIKVAVTTATSYTLGLGAFSWTPAATDISGVNNTLNVSGGTVSASIGLVTLDPGVAANFNSTVAQQTIDAPLATGSLAVAARAISGTVSANGTNGTYAGKIDLTASPAASNYTDATGKGATATGFAGAAPAVLGSYKFTVNTGNAKQLAGANNYTLAAGSTNANNTGATVVVTPGSGQSFPVGSTVGLYTDATCGTALAGANAVSGTVTAANAASAKTLTTTAAVVAGTDYFVCQTAPSATNTATPIQASIAATVAPAVAATNDSIAAASGNGYSLGYNGSTVDVYSYWPGGLSAYNFTGYLRVTNTGSVPADISLTHISPTDGTVVGAKVIVSQLAAKKTVLLTTQSIDAVVGVAPSGVAVGRARVTAPTDGLRVQSLLQFNNGNLVEFSN